MSGCFCEEGIVLPQCPWFHEPCVYYNLRMSKSLIEDGAIFLYNLYTSFHILQSTSRLLI